MSSQCFNDFCLSCDRQIAEGGVYCSQACRLADLEKAGSTQSHAATQQLSTSASSTSSSHSGFYLPPAVNFSAYKTPASPYHYYPTANGSYFAAASSTAQHTATTTTQSSTQRNLTPSSSQSSLASASSQPQAGISKQAASQLNGYMRAFDQTRDMKRRYSRY